MKKNIQLLAIGCLTVYLLFNSFQTKAQNSANSQVVASVYLTGTAKLVNGEATITFNDKSADILPENNVQILITSIDSWSGVYITDSNAKGFKVKSETGNLNASFGWMIVGGRKEDKIGISK